jgi:hypothetical protein
MRVLAQSSEDDMIAHFLRGELASERFGPALEDALARAGTHEPTLFAPGQEALRRQVLEETRAYVSRSGLFDGFPDDVRWQRISFEDDEVE